MNGLERLKTETGAVIVLLHHEGKDESRGMMGATTLKGAIDAEFKVRSEDDLVTVESGKSKDDTPATFTFQTRVVDVLNPVTKQPMLTRKGKQVTTLTLKLADDADRPDRHPKTKLSDPQANALQAFLNWLIGTASKSMPVDQWTPVMTGAGVVDDRKRAKEVRDALDRKGLIRIEKELIYSGREL